MPYLVAPCQREAVGVGAGLDDVAAEGAAVDDRGAAPWVEQQFGAAAVEFHVAEFVDAEHVDLQARNHSTNDATKRTSDRSLALVAGYGVVLGAVALVTMWRAYNDRRPRRRRRGAAVPLTRDERRLHPAAGVRRDVSGRAVRVGAEPAVVVAKPPKQSMKGPSRNRYVENERTVLPFLADGLAALIEVGHVSLGEPDATSCAMRPGRGHRERAGPVRAVVRPAGDSAVSGGGHRLLLNPRPVAGVPRQPGYRPVPSDRRSGRTCVWPSPTDMCVRRYGGLAGRPPKLTRRPTSHHLGTVRQS